MEKEYRRMFCYLVVSPLLWTTHNCKRGRWRRLSRSKRRGEERKIKRKTWEEKGRRDKSRLEGRQVVEEEKIK